VGFEIFFVDMDWVDLEEGQDDDVVGRTTEWAQDHETFCQYNAVFLCFVWMGLNIFLFFNAVFFSDVAYRLCTALEPFCFL
jgi:hypothetical protein